MPAIFVGANLNVVERQLAGRAAQADAHDGFAGLRGHAQLGR